MKKSSELLAAVAIGGALGMLLAPAKGSDTRKKIDTQVKKVKKLLRGGQCSKEKLIMVKGKIENHKARVEKALQRIDAKIAAYDIKNQAENNI